MDNKSQYFNLNVLRGACFVTSYPFRGTKMGAQMEAKRLQEEVHAGSVVSVENKSGLVVAVIR